MDFSQGLPLLRAFDQARRVAFGGGAVHLCLRLIGHMFRGNPRAKERLSFAGHEICDLHQCFTSHIIIAIVATPKKNHIFQAGIH